MKLSFKLDRIASSAPIAGFALATLLAITWLPGAASAKPVCEPGDDAPVCNPRPYKSTTTTTPPTSTLPQLVDRNFARDGFPNSAVVSLHPATVTPQVLFGNNETKSS